MCVVSGSSCAETMKEGRDVMKVPPGEASSIGRSSFVVDILTEHDSDAIDVSQPELANAIRLVRWRRGDLGAAIKELPVVRVDVLHPLEQVDSLRNSLISYEVDR